MELDINKCSVHSVTLKCNYSLHDCIILGTMHTWVTNHDYLGVSVSSDQNWLNHIKKNSTRLAKPYVYLEEPYPPDH